ncbi:MAG: hypothetical protein R3182_13295 [Draconibacterium sp.]|nr:hypothetical protein [Draconibacterium sp.]
MKKKKLPILSNYPEGFKEEKINLNEYEVSFRRWLISEIDSGNVSFQEARDKFQLGRQYRRILKNWQLKYSDEIHLSLQSMSAKERTDVKALEKRIKELKKQLELAQIKNVALNTMIDIAENDYKLEIRKKSGPKQ